jgi:mannose-6-phosphate isomerase-like protein (cupin superfamily)
MPTPPRPTRPRAFLLAGLLSAAAFSLAARAQTPPPAAAAPLLTSMVYDWNSLVPKELPSGQRRIAFDRPTVGLAELECHITTLNPGQTSGAPHVHTNEELTIVNAGTVEVIINDRRQTVGPGSVFYFAPQDKTGIRNPGTVPAVYAVIEIAVPGAAAAGR